MTRPRKLSNADQLRPQPHMTILIPLSTLTEAFLTIGFVAAVIVVSRRVGLGAAAPEAEGEAGSKKKAAKKGKKKAFPPVVEHTHVPAPAPTPAPAPAPAVVEPAESATKKKKKSAAKPAAAAPPAPTPAPELVSTPAPAPAPTKKAKKSSAPPPPPAPLPTPANDASSDSESQSEEEPPHVLHVGKPVGATSDGWEEWPSLSSNAAGEDDGWEVAKPKSPSFRLLRSLVLF